jgi:diguanylate cyclase (GGDEF)-like protein
MKRVAPFPRLRFGSLQSRLTVLYTGLFAAIAITVGVVTHVLVIAHARNAVRAEMVTSGGVYDRLWALKTEALGNAAGVLSRDFGFRTAVASGDRPTIESALVNLRARAGVPIAVVVNEDGTVTGDAGLLQTELSRLPGQVSGKQHDTVVATAHGVYRLVISPILAPNEIGLVVFALRLDGAEMKALERLSAIPLTATMIQSDGHHWAASDGAAGIASSELDSLMRQTGQRRLAELPLHRGQAYALVKQLNTAATGPQAAILVSYSIDAALASYAPLQAGLLVAGLIGIALVFVGSRKLARGIARPIAILREAASALEGGTRSEVPVIGDDEIGNLSAAFNRMSAGIIERENRISHMAFHDALTGLPNRAFFHQHLEQSLARAARTREPLAVLCLDLDSFKAVNDSLGHPAGDGLLKAVAAILSELAEDGLVSRLGGDEFAIVLAGNVAPDRPRALAQMICTRLADPVMVGERNLAISASIGVGMGSLNGDTADELLKNADLALYRAKEDGKSCFRFFDESLDAAARKRHQIEVDLRQAVQEGQFALHYQPIFDLKRNRVTGFEALLRWFHPTLGLISPTDFIPVAEETGLILAIGEWVLREACRQAAEWPSDVRVAVNVSPLQFRNPNFFAIIMHALVRSGIAPSRLEVEITETVFLDGEQPVLEVLHKLRNAGVRVALDDFGTGYSSLSYLRSFPFDKIKIDRSFVTDVANNASAAAIVNAIVDLATALNMETTAEGVEDDRQLDSLRDQGCGSIQGFLFSRPVEPHKIDALLGELRKVA